MGCGASKNDGSTARIVEARPQPSGESSHLSYLRQTCLKSHNEKRAKHGAPPLILTEELNTMAQKWADHLGQTGKFEHSKGRNNAGENLAGYHWLSTDTGEIVTSMWYDEIQDYDFNNPGYDNGTGVTGHFTQVVWKDTKELGVGMARNEKRKFYVFVANYRPSGNVISVHEFRANVLPAQ